MNKAVDRISLMVAVHLGTKVKLTHKPQISWKLGIT